MITIGFSSQRASNTEAIPHPFCRMINSRLWPCSSQLPTCHLNTLRPRQDGRHFPDDIFKWTFLNENVWISLKNLLEFIPQVSIYNSPALVQIMAWRRPGDKPLSEPMMASLLTHICVTRPQWVNVHMFPVFSEACTQQWVYHMYLVIRRS